MVSKYSKHVSKQSTMEAEFRGSEPGPGGPMYSLVRVEGWLGGWVAGLGRWRPRWLVGCWGAGCLTDWLRQLVSRLAMWGGFM